MKNFFHRTPKPPAEAVCSHRWKYETSRHRICLDCHIFQIALYIPNSPLWHTQYDFVQWKQEVDDSHQRDELFWAKVKAEQEASDKALAEYLAQQN